MGNTLTRMSSRPVVAIESRIKTGPYILMRHVLLASTGLLLRSNLLRSASFQSSKFDGGKNTNGCGLNGRCLAIKCRRLRRVKIPRTAGHIFVSGETCSSRGGREGSSCPIKVGLHTSVPTPHSDVRAPKTAGSARTHKGEPPLRMRGLPLAASSRPRPRVPLRPREAVEHPDTLGTVRDVGAPRGHDGPSRFEKIRALIGPRHLRSDDV